MSVPADIILFYHFRLRRTYYILRRAGKQVIVVVVVIMIIRIENNIENYNNSVYEYV